MRKKSVVLNFMCVPSLNLKDFELSMRLLAYTGELKIVRVVEDGRRKARGNFELIYKAMIFDIARHTSPYKHITHIMTP